MTKADAIKRVIQDNNGIATWPIIYNEIEKYYRGAKKRKEWKAALRGVLYRAVSDKQYFKKVGEGLFALIDYDENSLILDEDKNTQGTSVAKVRRGQDRFRKKLFKELESQCPITNINDERVLLASHIKPWAKSTDNERLDVYNGFILSPLFDKLFDSGLITFSLRQEIIISKSLSNENIEKIGVKNKQVIGRLPICGRENYLQYHQSKIFQQ